LKKLVDEQNHGTGSVSSKEKEKEKEKERDKISEWESEISAAKLQEAVRHSAFRLRKQFETVRDRMERVRGDLKSSSEGIVEHLTAYHRNVQAVLPADLAANLLPTAKRGGAIGLLPLHPLKVSSSSDDSLSLPRKMPGVLSFNPLEGGGGGGGGGGASVSLSSSLSHLDWHADTASFKSGISSSVSLPTTLTLGLSAQGASAGDGRKMQETQNQRREQLLERVSKSLNQSSAKKGAVGSMPLAPINSHLAVRNSTHTQGNGRR
jgi:hypothetical protein